MPALSWRTAVLALPGLEPLSLHEPERGWALQNLVLGYPGVREVVTPWADRSGADDQTAFYSTRAVSADVLAWRMEDEGGLTVDDIAELFGAYVTLPARPTLTYTTHSAGPPVPRMLHLRPADYAADMVSIARRAIHLAWVSTDIAAWAADPNGDGSGRPSSTRAWAGSSVLGGRQYDLSYDPADAPADMIPGPAPPGAAFTWNAATVMWDGGTVGGDEVLWGWHPPNPGVRWYPPGGQLPVPGCIHNRGHVPVSPLITVFGPIEAPVIFSEGGCPDGATSPPWRILTRPSLVVPAGRSLVFDTANRTVVWGNDGTPDDGANAMASVDWFNTTWPAVPAGTTSEVRLSGESTADNTQLTAEWRDGWLL